MEVLKGAGYTTCFFLGGGNSMHLLESASKKFNCIPVVHEVTASISETPLSFVHVVNSPVRASIAVSINGVVGQS